MSRTTAAQAPMHPPSVWSNPRPGGYLWATQSFLKCLSQWRTTLRGTAAFLIASCLAVVINDTFNYPGGVILAIPVLMIPVVAHSLRLLALRVSLVVVSTAITLVFVQIFQEQPWIILLGTVALIVVGLYLVVQGLDMLAWMICVAIPVITLFQGSVTVAITDGVWMGFNRVLLSLLCAEVVALCLLRSSAEPQLRALISTWLHGLANTITLTPAERAHSNAPRWTTEQNDHLMRLMQQLRVERGGSSVTFQNLEALSHGALILLGGGAMWTIKPLRPWNPAWEETCNHLPARVRRLAATQLRELADATIEQREARQIPDIQTRHRDILEAAQQAMTSSSELSTVEEASSLANPLMRFVIMCKTLETMRAFSGLKPTAGSTWWYRLGRRSPGQRSLFSASLELLHTPNRWGMLFALKGGLVAMIAFTVGAAYSWWGGVQVLVLMTLLLSALNMGAVTASFVQRMVGLAGALVVAYLALMLVVPQIDGPWSFAIMLAICLAPGAVAMQFPHLMSLGLSWSMTLMFTVTSSIRPLADLDPLQERFLSVTAATLLSWLVFLLVCPVYARDRVDDSFGIILRHLASVGRNLSGPSPVIHEEEALRYKAVRAMSAAAAIARETKLELDKLHPGISNIHTILNGLDDMFVMQCDLLRMLLSARRHQGSPECLQAIGRVCEAQANTFEAMAVNLGRSPESIQPFLNAGSTALHDLRGQLHTLLERRADRNPALLPILAMFEPLNQMDTRMHELHQMLKSRRDMLDQSAPLVVAGER